MSERRPLPVRALRRYLRNQGQNGATLIAWNMFFAFFPIVLVTVTIAGLVLQDASIRAGLYKDLAHAFPGNGGTSVIQALDAFREKAGIFALIGFIGLLWSGSSLFGTMDSVLSRLYGAKPRTFVAQKLMAVGMIFLFTLLIIPLVLSSSILPLLHRLSFVPSVLTSGSAAVLLQLAAGVLDATVLLAVIYLVVPNRHQTVRGVLPGALLGALLFEGFTLVFPIYFRVAGGFASYGQTFAIAFLLLFYFYVVSQIIVLAASFDAEVELGDDAEQEGATALTGTAASPPPSPGRSLWAPSRSGQTSAPSAAEAAPSPEAPRWPPRRDERLSDRPRGQRKKRAWYEPDPDEP